MIQQMIDESVSYIRSLTQVMPEYALILGSGLGDLGDVIEEKTVISYGDIPGFFASTAVGHAGELIIGFLEGVPVVAMKGRIHCYEGRTVQQAVYPLRVMHALGAETLIVTNAAGGINESFAAGDLMVITDHINLSGRNPLIGPNEDSLGVRFPSMCHAYDPELVDTAKAVAESIGFALQEGVYLYTLGPSYETPAEIRMMRVLGADAVGMSTVPEVIAARHMQMRVLGISCISNMAAGITKRELSHQEVMDTGKLVKDKFTALIRKIIAQKA